MQGHRYCQKIETSFITAIYGMNWDHGMELFKLLYQGITCLSSLLYDYQKGLITMEENQEEASFTWLDITECNSEV